MARRSTVEDFIVDFSKEEEGGGGARYKPGTYLFTIVSGKTGTSEDKGTPYLELTLKFKEGKYKGKKLTERLYVSPKAYSRFRLLMEALDLKPPAKLNLVKLIPKLKGGELYCEIDDDDSRDTVRSRVTYQGFINPDDYDPEGDDEDEEDEEEDEDLEGDEDEDEEEEEDEPPARKRRSRAKKAPAKKSRRAPVDDEDEDEEDEDEEDEEDEEPPPRRRKAAAKKAPAKKSRSKRRARDEDEDEDDDLEDLDLDDM